MTIKFKKKHILAERPLKWRSGLSSLCPILGPVLYSLDLKHNQQQKSEATKTNVVAAVATTAIKISLSMLSAAWWF